jgi:hypothetical protein
MTHGQRNCRCSGWLGLTLNLVRLTSLRLLNTICARYRLNQPTDTISFLRSIISSPVRLVI